MLEIEPINPDPSQSDQLPYSPSIRVKGGADMLFISGSTALPLYHSHPNIHEEHVLPDAIKEQTRRAMEDIMMVTFSPEKVAKYNDNRALGEAMRAIPVNNSVLVTEELTYLPSGGTVISAKGQRRNALFSSLFGHQMFSSWGRHW